MIVLSLAGNVVEITGSEEVLLGLSLVEDLSWSLLELLDFEDV